MSNVADLFRWSSVRIETSDYYDYPYVDVKYFKQDFVLEKTWNRKWGWKVCSLTDIFGYNDFPIFLCNNNYYLTKSKQGSHIHLHSNLAT